MKKYQISKPITTMDELKKLIPKYESIALVWDDEWTLFYITMFKDIHYRDARGHGDFNGKNKFFLYKTKIEPQSPIVERDWNFDNDRNKKWSESYKCPNCGEYIEPYGTDIWRQFILHTARTKFCDGCGLPLRWY